MDSKNKRNDGNDSEWDEFISQFPIYDNQKPIPYDFSTRTIYGHHFFSPDELIHKSGNVLVDNSTIFDSAVILGIEEGLLSFSQKELEHPFRSSGWEVCKKLFDDLILFDQLLVLRPRSSDMFSG
ncbi:hypothetical protein KA005_53690, partial [bacterium]|nr:hypothetical protein [bacterium]